jgi:hypothetical protein
MTSAMSSALVLSRLTPPTLVLLVVAFAELRARALGRFGGARLVFVAFDPFGDLDELHDSLLQSSWS